MPVRKFTFNASASTTPGLRVKADKPGSGCGCSLAAQIDSAAMRKAAAAWSAALVRSRKQKKKKTKKKTGH